MTVETIGEAQGTPVMSAKVIVPINQPKRLFFQRLVLSIISGLMCCSSFGKVEAQNVLKRNLTAQVFLPAPRELMRELDRAKEDIDREQFVDAITRLNFILNGNEESEFGEDYFLPARKGKPRLSLKREADRLISSMPKKGAYAYELAYGTDAAKRLEKAVADRDYAVIEDISRRYGNTKAGEEATLLLGHKLLMEGNSLESLLHFQRLAQSEHAAERFGKDLKMMQAAALRLAGRTAEAKEVLVASNLNDPKDAALLTSLQPTTVQEQTSYEWPMLGGNVTRDGNAEADLPLRTVAWQAPNVIGDPKNVKALSDLAKSKFSSGGIPAVHPLLVGDFVLARSTEHLIGASMKYQLKREWQYPGPGGGDGERSLSEAKRQARMKQRVWDNSLYGQVCSDGEFVFLISSIPDSLRARSNTAELTNTLVALDLAGQGKKKWIVGKDDNLHEPALRGMFFLGVPLPLGDSLFCVGERNSEIRVMELEKSTGKLLWSQQLAHVEPRNRYSRQDLRRMSGMNLAYADGILVCPTSTGGAIGIDLSQKRFVWGYEYAVKQQQVGRVVQPRLTDRWRDNWAIVDSGRVVLTPWDADEMYCLDLLTGESLWNEKVPKGDGRFVAGVHKDDVIVVGKSSVSAIRVDDGKTRWKRALRGAPSGRGIKTDSHYLLATTEPELIKIDLDTGKIVDSVATIDPLGNLIASEEMIISQNSLWLRTFYQRNKLRKKVDRRLADNPKDPWALEHDGYLLLDAGEHLEGLDRLRMAISSYRTLDTPGIDYLAKKRLVDETFEMLLEDDGVPALELADEIRPYLPKSRESEYWRVMTELNLKEGRLGEAFESNVTLFMDSLAEASRVLIDPEMMEFSDRRIRPDRWHRSMFRAIWQAANLSEKERMREQISAWLAKTEGDERSALLEVTQDIPFLNREYLGLLADRLAVKGKTPYVEGSLYRLSQVEEQDVAGRATALLAKLYQTSGQMLAAAAQCDRLSNEFGDVVVWPTMAADDEQTGKQLVAAAIAENAGLEAYLASSVNGISEWGFGVVTAENEKSEEPPSRNYALNGFSRYNSSLNGFVPVRSEHGRLWNSGMQWVTSYSPAMQLEIRDPFGQSIATLGKMFINSRPGREPKVKTFGHLAVGSFDNSVVALNGLRDGTDTVSTELWRDVRSGATGVAGSPIRELKFGQLGLSRKIEYGPGGRSPVSLGCVSDRGVIFRRSGDLLCVDPASGEVLWQRDDLRVEAEVWGDDEFVFAHVDKRFGGGNARVFSVFDGSELESRPVPNQGERLRAFGRHVLAWRKDVGGEFDMVLDPNRVVDDILKAKDPKLKIGPKQRSAFKNRLEMRDLFNRSRRFEWSRTYGGQARACWINYSDLAIFDPDDGKLEIISVLDGKSTVLSTIKTELPRVDTLTVRERAGLYIVTLGQNSDGMENGALRYKSPIAVRALQNIEVYAYSPEGEMIWGVPAKLKNFRELPTYADGIPLMVFSRKNESNSNRAKREFETVVLDVRDGHVAFQNSGLFQGSNKFKLTGRHGEGQVELQLPEKDGKWTLTFTDGPRAPTLPYGYATSQVPEPTGVFPFWQSLMRGRGKGSVPAKPPVP